MAQCGGLLAAHPPVNLSKFMETAGWTQRSGREEKRVKMWIVLGCGEDGRLWEQCPPIGS